MSKMKMLLLAAGACLHFNAGASLLDPAELDAGGLTWLQLRETTGLSLNDFDTGVGGWNTQYRLATDAEISGLLSGLGLPLDFSDYHVSAPGAANFIFQLGGPFGTGPDMANPFAAARGLGWFAYARLTDGENGAPLSADCPAYTVCGMSITLTGTQDANLRGEGTGLFLVRRAADVPEPSTLALMGLSTVLLAVRRRKQQG